MTPQSIWWRANRALGRRIRLSWMGWRAFFRAMRLQLRKKHGAGRPLLRQAVWVAQCARYIVSGQHRRPLWQRVAAWWWRVVDAI